MRIADDADVFDMAGKTHEEIEEAMRKQEARARAVTLTMVRHACHYIFV